MNSIKKGYSGTSAGNGYAYYTTAGNISSGFLAKTVRGYMSDSDTSNISAVGHRRWVLCPVLKKTGFGFAQSTTNLNNHMYTAAWSFMYVFDENGDRNFGYDYIAWPNKGYFPTEFFGAKDAWSVSLNPNKYDVSNGSNIKVSLTRESDKKVWNLDSSNKNMESDYFNIDKAYIGDIPFCIIFRPGDITELNDGDVYHVKISGVKLKDGTPGTIEYTVNYFSLKKSFSERKQIVLQIGNPYMEVNSAQVEIDPGRGTKPVLDGDYTLLPIRALVEALGGTVEWIEQGTTGYINITLSSTQIMFMPGDSTAYVNGVPKKLNTPAKIINDRTMVPLRFVIENLGYEVTWEETSQKIYINYTVPSFSIMP